MVHGGELFVVAANWTDRSKAITALKDIITFHKVSRCCLSVLISERFAICHVFFVFF